MIDQGARGHVHVASIGRLGNNLFQYCLGRILAEGLGFDLQVRPLAGFDHATGWGAPPAEPPARTTLLRAHDVDLAGILADPTPRLLLLRGYFQRYAYYRPYKRLIRESWLACDAVPRAAPDDLTIHVRAGDIWQRGRPSRRAHPDYHALPFSFYDAILRSRRWGKVTVVTEDRFDPMVCKLVAHCGAEVQAGSVLEDFKVLRASANLVMSVSSYAWWAAWLSDAARIYFPLVGIFDPRRMQLRRSHWRPDLWVDDEPRYQRVRPPGMDGPWIGDEAERLRLLNT